MASLKTLVLSLLLSAVTYATPLPSGNLEKRQSSIPVGTIITSCTVPGTAALTFDDGPYIYTEQLLDILGSNGVHATFFQNGQNYGNINNYASTVQRIVDEGHQIGSHTWSHADLNSLDTAGVTSQMTQLEAAYSAILGYFPTYMRPPYFDLNAQVLKTLGGLGYHVITANIDTLDFENATPALIGNAYNNFLAGINAGGNLELSHDVYATTVQTLAQRMIDELKAKGLSAVTVGECLGDPASNWYRTGR